MAYNTPETVADYLARFQMEITHRGKGTFTPDHVKYSLTIASGGKDFFTTFESNPRSRRTHHHASLWCPRIRCDGCSRLRDG